MQGSPTGLSILPTMGNLVVMLGVAMGTGLAGTAPVPVSQLWRGPGAVALGGLQCRY